MESLRKNRDDLRNGIHLVALLLVLGACAESKTGADAAVTRSMDAGRADAGGADAGPNDAGSEAVVDAAPTSPIDPEAIYQIDECPPRAVGTLVLEPTNPSCTRSADCTQRANGRCNGYERDSGTVDFPRCGYDACVSNADCAAGERCECSFHGLLACVRVGCEGDDDCASDERCERTPLGCYEYLLGDYLCTTPSDQCLTHADCLSSNLGNHCIVEGERRVCISHTCE